MNLVFGLTLWSTRHAVNRIFVGDSEPRPADEPKLDHRWGLKAICEDSRALESQDYHGYYKMITN